jgi:hypothetical protein
MKNGMKLVDLLGIIRKLQSTGGNLGFPLPDFGAKSDVDVLTLLGEDAWLQALPYQVDSALDLSIRAQVGYRGLVHLDVVIIIEIQDFSSVN